MTYRNVFPMAEAKKGGMDIIVVSQYVETQVAKMLRGRC